MPRSQPQKETFSVGDWTVEPELLLVRRDETSHRLEPMVMALLVHLAGRAPRVVSRQEILEEVWEGRVVVDETVTRAVSMLRQAFGDDARNPTYIETIPTRGYRLMVPVQPGLDGPGPSGQDPADPGSATRSEASPQRPRLPPAIVAGLVLLAAVAALLLFARGPEGNVDPAPSAPVETDRPGIAVRTPAIAVLPFTASPEDAVLADGLTDELIHLLSRMDDLRVVSRISSMRFRDPARSLGEIARTLEVDYLLEGSVLSTTDRVRIHARLVRPTEDETLLSRRYERQLVDVLALQREVARDVAREIRVPLSSEERLRSGAEGPVDPEAYRLYLRASSLLKDRRQIRLAASLFERSVAIDPTFSLAWAGLAEVELLAVQYLTGRSHERAAGAVARALELDDRLAQAHAARGLLMVSRDQNWAEAERSFERAIELEPSYSTAYQWYSEMLSLTGRHDEALAQVEKARDLDPLSPLVLAATGQRLSAARRYQAAERELLAAEDLDAQFAWHLGELAYVRERLGDEPGAIDARRRQLQRRGLSEAEFDDFEKGVAEAGMDGFWRWYHSYLESVDDRFPMRRAEAAAALGLDAEALAWLESTLVDQALWFLQTQRSPAFDELRQDPSYLELVAGYPLWTPTPSLPADRATTDD